MIRPEPKHGIVVKTQSESLALMAVKMMPTLSRSEAIRFVLAAQPKWFWQTPEGEYLLWLADKAEAEEKGSVA